MAFMHEGGLAMWATLILFLIGAAMAVVRRKEDGWRVALGGAVFCIASGLAGFATGLYNTVAYLGQVAIEQRVEILGTGMRESAHNVLFAAILAFALAVLALSIGKLSIGKAVKSA